MHAVFPLKDIGSSFDFTCGYCGREVSSSNGLTGENAGWGKMLDPHNEIRFVYIVGCPRCGRPTYFGEEQVPGVPFGEKIDHLPEDVAKLYDQARRSISVGSYSGAILLGRKLLMHVSVSQGAPPNQKFYVYVNHLVDNAVVTAAMKDWVDEIRELGNEETHELFVAARDEAEALLTFVAMLLKIVYEYPEKGRQSVTARAAREAAADAP
jgi:Domain of unknown function (DUF4145)